ncbi:hypothetical protein BDZ91DRAFT_728225 [Kalaharituber pfeilii]|nr:hypothetical protein BDZ91DRAFT_728225 [Kalaharituber pfeilii]
MLPNPSFLYVYAISFMLIPLSYPIHLFNIALRIVLPPQVYTHSSSLRTVPTTISPKQNQQLKPNLRFPLLLHSGHGPPGARTPIRPVPSV